MNMHAPSSLLTCPVDESSPIHEIENSHYSQNEPLLDRLKTISNVPFELPSPMKEECIRTVDPLSDRRWDDLVARHPRASTFHQRSWLEALAHTYGYEPVVFTTSLPSAELKNGLLFCEINSWLTGRRLVSLPFSDHCEPICDSTEELITLIQGSQTVLDRQHGQYLEFRPTSDEFGQAAAEIGFLAAGRYFFHVMDLRPSLEAVFGNLDKDSVQRRIKRAERAGLVEKCGTSEDLLREFYSLLVITRRRHQLPPPPFAWFQNLVRFHGKALEIRVAYKDDYPVAAILTLRFREIGYFKYGCSDVRFNRFAATPWLLWRAITAAKANGALQFDLGRTQEGNAGLLEFKNRWVCRHQRLTYWRFPSGPSLDEAGGWKLNLAKRAFSHMPKRLLVASGRLLYRHIG